MARPSRSSRRGRAPGRALEAPAPFDGDDPRASRLKAGLSAGVCVAGLVAGLIGVAKTDVQPGPLTTLALAVVVVGVLSSGVGEYLSASGRRDTELAELAREERQLAEDPEDELEELANIYEAKGLSSGTARQVARELTEHDAFAAHADAELKIDPDQLTEPWRDALLASFSCAAGAAVPLPVILLLPPFLRTPVVGVLVLVGLVAAGFLGARLAGASPLRTMLRVVCVGAVAFFVTYGVGLLVGSAV